MSLTHYDASPVIPVWRGPSISPSIHPSISLPPLATPPPRSCLGARYGRAYRIGRLRKSHVRRVEHAVSVDSSRSNDQGALCTSIYMGGVSMVRHVGRAWAIHHNLLETIFQTCNAKAIHKRVICRETNTSIELTHGERECQVRVYACCCGRFHATQAIACFFAIAG